MLTFIDLLLYFYVVANINIGVTSQVSNKF